MGAKARVPGVCRGVYLSNIHIQYVATDIHTDITNETLHLVALADEFRPGIVTQLTSSSEHCDSVTP